ncbi:MAG: hypothetical protein ACLT8V_04250 [Streptococcus salivarius]
MSRGTSVNKDRHEMNTHGVWSATVKKDLDGVAYQFRVYHEETSIRIRETPTVLPLA